MMKSIRIQSRRNEESEWDSGRVDSHMEGYHIYDILVLSEEEAIHSIAPSSVILTHSRDGRQLRYTLEKEAQAPQRCVCEGCKTDFKYACKPDEGEEYCSACLFEGSIEPQSAVTSPKRERPSFDDYFMAIAKVVATRADCRRASHGSVLVRDNRVLSAGYNGLPSKQGSCLEGDCPRGLLSYQECPAFGDYSSCRGLHSEQNAIAYARQDLTGATIYVYGGKAPCDMCSKLIKAAGIVRVVHDGPGETL